MMYRRLFLVRQALFGQHNILGWLYLNDGVVGLSVVTFTRIGKSTVEYIVGVYYLHPLIYMGIITD